MSTDKLSRMAQAAGFAMACDDGLTPTSSRAAQPVAAPKLETSARERAREQATSLIARLGFGQSVAGWSFWKAA